MPFALTPLVLTDPELVMVKVSSPLSGGVVGPWVPVTALLIVVVSASANCGDEIVRAHKAADLIAWPASWLLLLLLFLLV
jgi:hypothetical protein